MATDSARHGGPDGPNSLHDGIAHINFCFLGLGMARGSFITGLQPE
jgi:hypothetical protein